MQTRFTDSHMRLYGEMSLCWVVQIGFSELGTTLNPYNQSSLEFYILCSAMLIVLYRISLYCFALYCGEMVLFCVNITGLWPNFALRDTFVESMGAFIKRTF